MFTVADPSWHYQTLAVLPRSHMRHLAQKLPKLLHQAAAPGKAIQVQISTAQGQHAYLVQLPVIKDLPLHKRCNTTPAFLQASLGSRLAPTSADWLRTCNRSGTMRPTPTWAASSLRPKATGRSGGGAACAGLGIRTGGWRESDIAHWAATAIIGLAKQSAPATIWPTTTQRWQMSGTGTPMGNRHQRVCGQAAQSRRPGGVATVGTDGAPLCR